MAAQLVISPSTADHHVRHIYDKMAFPPAPPQRCSHWNASFSEDSAIALRLTQIHTAHMATIDDEIQAAAAFTPADSPLTLRDIIQSPKYRDLSTPKLAPGKPAVDFTLPPLDFSDGRGKRTGRWVTLSDYAGRQPVALIFGSYT
ncbi:MAG: hypothetical protein ACR2HB_09485 [Dehalococcoidia bacterium]